MMREMKKMLHISVTDGFKRPHDTVQATKITSEAGVIARSSIPILTHWKHYKQDKNLIDGFVGWLSVSSSYPVYYARVTFNSEIDHLLQLMNDLNQ
jgi:hypothetical protein